jgi:RNA polymerase sigma factor (sigma-70 family)
MSDLVFPQTRWSLVGKVAGGGAGPLIERYATGIAAYLKLKFPDLPGPDLDDVTQEVLLHLLSHPDLLTGAKASDHGRFRYYLATVAFNQARNVVRSLRRSAAHQAHLDHEPTFVPTEVDQAWESAALTAAWQDLRGWVASGEIEAEAVDLLERHLGEGIPLRDLAHASGLSLATCQRRVAKARTWLQEAVQIRLSAHE